MNSVLFVNATIGFSENLFLVLIVNSQGLYVFLGEIWQCIYILCDFLSTNQMALSFNINILAGYIFIARPN